MSGLGRSVIEAALAAAARAPSAHNTQPWRVVVEREADVRVVVRADESRWLRHGDASRRDLRLSVGAFIEAVRLSLGASGVRAETSEAAADGATLVLRPGEPPTADARAAESLLRRRRTSRLRYSPRAPEPAALEALAAAAAAAGLALHVVDRAAAERRDLEGWFYAAARESWLDERAVLELARWIRVDPEGARRPVDGLSTHCLGLSPAETVGFAAAMRPGLWRAAHATFLAPVIAAALARAEARGVEEAPFLGVLVAPGDGGAAGAGLLQVWLAATRAGLSLAPLSVLLDRRGWELGRRLGVSPTRLVLAFRLGRSAPAPLSGRRPVAAFTSFGDAARQAPSLRSAGA
jgi:nitroreductase